MRIHGLLHQRVVASTGNERLRKTRLLVVESDHALLIFQGTPRLVEHQQLVFQGVSLLKQSRQILLLSVGQEIVVTVDER